mgnify:CR=1 FL=1
MVRSNSSDEYEFLCKVILTKDKFPIAFENKAQELIEECGMTREQAEEENRENGDRTGSLLRKGLRIVCR